MNSIQENWLLNMPRRVGWQGGSAIREFDRRRCAARNRRRSATSFPAVSRRRFELCPEALETAAFVVGMLAALWAIAIAAGALIELSSQMPKG